MTAQFRIRPTLVALGLVAFLSQSAGAAEPTAYSGDSPPPASFIHAGPSGGRVDESGNPTVSFRFVAMVHSLQPTRVQVLDADSGEVLVDDAYPSLRRTPYRHPTKPDVSVFQWEGSSATEKITDSEPLWLHDGTTTNVNLEIRLYSGERLEFSFRQPASYSADAKSLLLQAVEHNRNLDAAR